ncbi:hypothetical protein K438DRAFT_1995937 [Mycena galopus ATCC 62051]|nr:hypothetical protein K438DRAFT_1995937 [Mycena galopus ATCC 62051]
MDPPAAITITTAQETRTAECSDSESVQSNETMVTYSHVTTGTEAPKEMPLPTNPVHRLIDWCRLRPDDPDTAACNVSYPTKNPSDFQPSKGPILPSFVNLSTISAGMGVTEDKKSETNLAAAKKELAPLRNSDATTYDTGNPTVIPLHAPCPHLAYDPAALEDSAKNNEEKNQKSSILLRSNLFIHHITPERPQPLQPISTWITVHDFCHQDNRMTITVEVLPWGGYSFAAPFDYEHPIFEGKVLRFRGDLRGHWTVKEFIWERGGQAFLRVDEEDMDYRATIGFPRACVLIT